MFLRFRTEMTTEATLTIFLPFFSETAEDIVASLWVKEFDGARKIDEEFINALRERLRKDAECPCRSQSDDGSERKLRAST